MRFQIWINDFLFFLLELIWHTRQNDQVNIIASISCIFRPSMHVLSYWMSTFTFQTGIIAFEHVWARSNSIRWHERTCSWTEWMQWNALECNLPKSAPFKRTFRRIWGVVWRSLYCNYCRKQHLLWTWLLPKITT